jgi:hypothetical protein
MSSMTIATKPKSSVPAWPAAVAAPVAPRRKVHKAPAVPSAPRRGLKKNAASKAPVDRLDVFSMKKSKEQRGAERARQRRQKRKQRRAAAAKQKKIEVNVVIPRPEPEPAEPTPDPTPEATPEPTAAPKKSASEPVQETDRSPEPAQPETAPPEMKSAAMPVVIEKLCEVATGPMVGTQPAPRTAPIALDRKTAVALSQVGKGELVAPQVNMKRYTSPIDKMETDMRKKIQQLANPVQPLVKPLTTHAKKANVEPVVEPVVDQKPAAKANPAGTVVDVDSDSSSNADDPPEGESIVFVDHISDTEPADEPEEGPEPEEDEVSEHSDDEPTKVEELLTMTKSNLKLIAKSLKIKGVSRLNKDDLAQAIYDAQT